MIDVFEVRDQGKRLDDPDTFIDLSEDGIANESAASDENTAGGRTGNEDTTADGIPEFLLPGATP
jgi:hypothetical protein